MYLFSLFTDVSVYCNTKTFVIKHISGLRMFDSPISIRFPGNVDFADRTVGALSLENSWRLKVFLERSHRRVQAPQISVEHFEKFASDKSIHIRCN